MIKDSSPERVLQYFVWYCECSQHYRFPAASLDAGKHIGKGLYVMDLKVSRRPIGRLQPTSQLCGPRPGQHVSTG